MLKKIIAIFVITICFSSLGFGLVFGAEEILEEGKKSFGISDFLEEAKGYTADAFPELNISELFNSSIKGEMNLGFIKNVVIKALGTEITVAIRLMITVLIVIVINSICRAILENLGNEETNKIVYVLQYLIIVIFILTSFVSILKVTRETIDKLANFMNLLVPLFTSLILATGSITSTSVVEPILLFSINFISNFSNNFLIPILLIASVLSIVSHISDKVQISGIAKVLKSSIVWCLGIVLTIFTGMLSLEGNLTASVDGLTAKTAKAAVTTIIPVVGKILGDTVETVIGCSNILKNTVGFIGVVIIIGIVLVPIIKISVFSICFRLISGIGEAVADSKITKLVADISDVYKILLAILISMSVMFIIGITLVLKISNSSLMYR